MRPSNRAVDELRPISFSRHFTQHAEGSVLVCFGNTKVICTATVEEGVPRFLRDKNQGWVTGEYGMLPRSTNERMAREAFRGKQGGRTVEIQRLIGRSLRAAIDLQALGNYTIILDCDVIQADGGTRCAAISGASVALHDAINAMLEKDKLKTNPLKHFVAAVSVGIFNHTAILDLDYLEDSNAHTDMNVVMTDAGTFIELQGTAEGEAFKEQQLFDLLALAKKGISYVLDIQKQSLDL